MELNRISFMSLQNRYHSLPIKRCFHNRSDSCIYCTELEKSIWPITRNVSFFQLFGMSFFFFCTFLTSLLNLVHSSFRILVFSSCSVLHRHFSMSEKSLWRSSKGKVFLLDICGCVTYIHPTLLLTIQNGFI